MPIKRNKSGNETKTEHKPTKQHRVRWGVVGATVALLLLPPSLVGVGYLMALRSKVPLTEKLKTSEQEKTACRVALGGSGDIVRDAKGKPKLTDGLATDEKGNPIKTFSFVPEEQGNGCLQTVAALKNALHKCQNPSCEDREKACMETLPEKCPDASIRCVASDIDDKPLVPKPRIIYKDLTAEILDNHKDFVRKALRDCHREIGLEDKGLKVWFSIVDGKLLPNPNSRAQICDGDPNDANLSYGGRDPMDNEKYAQLGVCIARYYEENGGNLKPIPKHLTESIPITSAPITSNQ